jgi:hypothetical protein
MTKVEKAKRKTGQECPASRRVVIKKQDRDPDKKNKAKIRTKNTR